MTLHRILVKCNLWLHCYGLGWREKRSSLELSLNYLPMKLVAETSSVLQQQLVAHPLDTISLLPFSETTPSGHSVKTADESHKKTLYASGLQGFCWLRTSFAFSLPRNKNWLANKNHWRFNANQPRQTEFSYSFYFFIWINLSKDGWVTFLVGWMDGWMDRWMAGYA